MTRDQKVYLAIWRKVFQNPEQLPRAVEFETSQQAMAFRVGMFRAIKPYREAGDDPELTQAAALITIRRIQGTTVTLDLRATDLMLDLVVKDFDLDEADQISPEDRLLAEAMERAEEAAGQTKAPVQDLPPLSPAGPNPFFVRER